MLAACGGSIALRNYPRLQSNESLLPVKTEIEVQDESISLGNGALTAVIDKSDLSVSFYRDSKLLIT